MCQQSLIQLDKDGRLELFARHAEGVIVSVSSGGQWRAGKELVQLDLQRALQGSEQDTDDAGEGKSGLAGEVNGLAAVPINEIRIIQRGA